MLDVHARDAEVPRLCTQDYYVAMAQLDELLMPPAGAMPPGPNEMEEDDLFK